MLEQYLDTLERIPDDIVLSALTRDLDLFNGQTCLCGWVLREKLSQVTGKDAETIEVDTFERSVPEECAKEFGGTYEEWDSIYQGVTFSNRAPVIERALMLRVLEATM
jgi:hypothetical protein